MMSRHSSRQREAMTPYDGRSKPEPMTQQGHKREPMMPYYDRSKPEPIMQQGHKREPIIPYDSGSKREATTQQGHKRKPDHPVVLHRPKEIQQRGPPVDEARAGFFALNRMWLTTQNRERAVLSDRPFDIRCVLSNLTVIYSTAFAHLERLTN